MSSYSCRNAYGRAKSRLSEHGRANALDIRSFVTARGQTAAVVADWGMTAREIAAQAAAAAKAEEAKTAVKTAPCRWQGETDHRRGRRGPPLRAPAPAQVQGYSRVSQRLPRHNGSAARPVVGPGRANRLWSEPNRLRHDPRPPPAEGPGNGQQRQNGLPARRASAGLQVFGHRARPRVSQLAPQPLPRGSGRARKNIKICE